LNSQVSEGFRGTLISVNHFGTRITTNKNRVLSNISVDLSVIALEKHLYKIAGVKDNFELLKLILYFVIRSCLTGMTRYVATYSSSNSVRVSA
jgi:hypothetical protein